MTIIYALFLVAILLPMYQGDSIVLFCLFLFSERKPKQALKLIEKVTFFCKYFRIFLRKDTASTLYTTILNGETSLSKLKTAAILLMVEKKKTQKFAKGFRETLKWERGEWDNLKHGILRITWSEFVWRLKRSHVSIICFLYSRKAFLLCVRCKQAF